MAPKGSIYGGVEVGFAKKFDLLSEPAFQRFGKTELS